MKYHLLFLSAQYLMGWMRSISQTPTMQDGQLAIPAIDGVHRLLGRDTSVTDTRVSAVLSVDGPVCFIHLILPLCHHLRI